MVLDDEDWPRRLVEALDDSMKVDERSLALQGLPQLDVIAMVRIGTAIAVAEKSAVDEAVIVGALPVLDRRGGGDGEGDFGQDGGLEDPLWADQRDPGPSKSKPRSSTDRGKEASPKRRRCSARKSKARSLTAASR